MTSTTVEMPLATQAPRTRIERRLSRQEPIKVPPRSKTVLGTTWRWVALSRNGIRRTRRGIWISQNAIRKLTDGLGSDWYCDDCRQFVKERRIDEHNLLHRSLAEHNQSNVVTDDDEQFLADHRSTRPPRKRKPSRTKAAAREQKSLDSGDQNSANTAGESTGQTGPNMATTRSSGKGGGSSASGAVAKAFAAWGGYEITTVAELKAHLLGLNAAMDAAVASVHAFAAEQIVGQRIDPRVAALVDGAADALGTVGHNLVAADAMFETIYGARLDYERNQAAKPADSLFKETG